MPAFLRRLLDRSTRTVNRSAAGTAVPAGVDPREGRGPTARERTLMRRRLRSLRRRREALMREVGGLVLDTNHGENGAPERLDGRTHELEAVDAEARALMQALDELKTLDELTSTGISKRCESCGELVARREHFCPNCGAQVGPADTHVTEPHPSAGRGSAHPAAPAAAAVTGASSARSPSPPAR